MEVFCSAYVHDELPVRDVDVLLIHPNLGTEVERMHISRPSSYISLLNLIYVL